MTYAIGWAPEGAAEPSLYLSTSALKPAGWASKAQATYKPLEFLSLGALLDFVANMRAPEQTYTNSNFKGGGRFMILSVEEKEKTTVTKTYLPVLS